MIIVDVETSGITPVRHSLLSVGAVDFSNPGRLFYEECRIFDGAHVDKESLKINGFTNEEITDSKKKTDREVIESFLRWANEAKERTIAGQNPAFDRDFLQATAHRYHLDWKFAHRTIDLHSVCYSHMIEHGIRPPEDKGHSALNLDRILKYVGLRPREGKHNGLADAKLEAEAFSRLFYKRGLLPEYEKFPIAA
ncbi:MAG: Exonuclease RNase T and DNA polymerase III [Parcubacteria group bacterium GW2011_GWA2_47_21]|nr:MAG: Exonuclease RNase T and DNA polymerase III [Parcubacteria group bacterium GW2011_GWA2_47_21]